MIGPWATLRTTELSSLCWLTLLKLIHMHLSVVGLEPNP
jgi:hypothetical protein